MVLEKAISAYLHVADIMATIEQNLTRYKPHQILALIQEMESLQNDIREMDQEIMLTMRKHVQEHQGQINRLVSLMQEIQAANHRITPQVRSIMAVQKNELQKLKSGSAMMRKYHSHTPKSGRLLKSTS